MDYSKSRYSFQNTSSIRSSPWSVSQSRRLAYEIGTKARSKIQKEAAKTVPQLHRLVCHAAVYDNATKFILDHMHDYSPEIDHSELATIEEVEDVEEDVTLYDIVDIVPEDEHDPEPSHASLELPHNASFNGYAQLKSPRLCGVVVTTTLVGARDSHWEETESDSSTESDEDYDSDNEYDYHGYDGYMESGYTYGQYERRSDLHYARSCSKQFADSTPTYNHSNDDHLLWAQQPRVWSQQQEAHLFVEAFG
ncbi:uncharacterized protein A1O5_02375 [Cladophialophora psammophila CBS 110553]|uniref:Uncharacterized protein n=1 Tax=Cladophialophora psammophila CBS 110553 TaxID=1182543 RepID=W9XAY0_9EURO|nr:uncharacterized protein A1O5_02375 [Cladophialophora psammophila CBS 110553]EXJ74081.1 hypothetical protein A1O5_02375 [Cladophialophora psammophila CBS 110553]